MSGPGQAGISEARLFCDKEIFGIRAVGRSGGRAVGRSGGRAVGRSRGRAVGCVGRRASGSGKGIGESGAVSGIPGAARERPRDRKTGAGARLTEPTKLHMLLVCFGSESAFGPRDCGSIQNDGCLPCEYHDHLKREAGSFLRSQGITTDQPMMVWPRA
jgi:hypothetical protein